jgi:hypothetical protein
MAASRQVEIAPYLPGHEQAYQTLGIVLGAEDFDEKMEALKYLCAYYHEKKKQLTTNH